MKVSIDYDLCMGDRNCSKVCPEVFGYDEDKLLGTVLLPDVAEHLEGKVRQAADECGAKAIVLGG